MVRRLMNRLFEDDPDSGLHPFIGIPLFVFLSIAMVYAITENAYWVAVPCGITAFIVLVSVINAFRSKS